MPTTRGRNQLEAASGTMPRLANTNPTFASLDSTRMSMGSVMVTPMPTAEPFMAAITGLVHSKIRSVRRPPPSRGTERTSRPLVAAASNVAPPRPRSAPAQNPRPRPVTITARTSSSAST